MATEQQQGERDTELAWGEENRSNSEANERTMERTARTSAPARRSTQSQDPFLALRAISSDMDRWFERMFQAFALPSRMPWGYWTRALSWPIAMTEPAFWPEIEVQHRGEKLVIRADLPGLQKDDITIEILDHELCLSGERRVDSEHREGRYYRAERSYGGFRRNVPLPEGAKPDTASATFDNGVLAIEMDAPGWDQPQTRHIEVREGAPH